MSTAATTSASGGPDKPMADSATLTYIITGAVIGAAAVVIIVATAILCIVISMKKYYKRKSSIDFPSTGSEKSPNRDGYVNALYDSKSMKFNLTFQIPGNSSHVYLENQCMMMYNILNRGTNPFCMGCSVVYTITAPTRAGYSGQLRLTNTPDYKRWFVEHANGL
jgi:hypothetical protein